MLNEHIESWDRFSVETLRELADEHDVTWTSLSGDWVQLLEHDQNRHIIIGLDWGLNTSSAQKVAADKCATTDIIALGNVPTISHKLFLEPESLGNSGDHWSDILAWFKECNSDVVCKPNNSGGGRDVTRVQNEDELKQTVEYLFTQYRAIAIAPYVAIQNEYRITVLNGEAVLTYEKIRTDENELKFNLSSGAQAVAIEDESVREEITAHALGAAESIGITFANVDVVRIEGQLHILEINSDVTFKHYVEQGEKERRQARAVYEKAFARLWEHILNR